VADDEEIVVPIPVDNFRHLNIKEFAAKLLEFADNHFAASAAESTPPSGAGSVTISMNIAPTKENTDD
jgi:hypothetical protein